MESLNLSNDIKTHKDKISHTPNPPQEFDDHLKNHTPSHTLVDIGINITHAALKNHWEEVIQRAISAGVTRILLTGTSLPSSKYALSIAHSWNDRQKNEINLFCTVGVHPHDAKYFSMPSTIDAMRNMIISSSDGKKKPTPSYIVAVGECGLDFDRNFSSRDDQRRAFREQVALACELRMPLFVHEREAHRELMEVLDSLGDDVRLPPVVIHCFTGTAAEVKVYIDRGFYIGLTGVVCKKDRGAVLREEVLPIIPLERIMLETDAPFMGFKKGKRRHSEPAHVVDIAKCIGDCLGLPFERICDVTTANAIRFFNLNKQ